LVERKRLERREAHDVRVLDGLGRDASIAEQLSPNFGHLMEVENDRAVRDVQG